eukprot:SAG22_NODE_17670_length_300_cov_1.288557_1_plen_95_part_10
MDALSREIGSRGRADAVVAPGSSAATASEALSNALSNPTLLLQHELDGMRVSALRKRAVKAHINADLLEEALDAHDSKAALIQLIIDDASSRGPA